MNIQDILERLDQNHAIEADEIRKLCEEIEVKRRTIDVLCELIAERCG